MLELGGSDPFIVMPSADLDAAVATAVKARVINNGQSCIAAKRFIVAELRSPTNSSASSWRRMQNLRVGDPFDAQTELGPLATPDAVTTLDADVQKTVQAGAKVLTGGTAAETAGKLLRAHRADEHSQRFARPIGEEFFGPVASIFRAKIRTKPSASPTTSASAWAPAPGPTTTKSASASSTKSKRAWSSSIRWSPPTRAFRSAA